jgi:hypothetical protein
VLGAKLVKVTAANKTGAQQDDVNPTLNLARKRKKYLFSCLNQL